MFTAAESGEWSSSAKTLSASTITVTQEVKPVEGSLGEKSDFGLQCAGDERRTCVSVVRQSSPGCQVWPGEVLLQHTGELPGWRRPSVQWRASPAQIKTQWMKDSGVRTPTATPTMFEADLTLLAPTTKLWATLAMKPSTWTPRSLQLTGEEKTGAATVMTVWLVYTQVVRWHSNLSSTAAVFLYWHSEEGKTQSLYYF